MARIDFHVHTPASGDFLGGGETIEVLRTARERNVDVLVIADHNSLDGYLGVVDQLDEFAPMLVLPGIEVTCRGGASGIHVIGVLDPGQLGRRPRRILGPLGLDPDERHVDGLSSLDVVGVCDVIHGRGGLAIAAHAASSKGVLRELRGQQLSKTLERCGFDAFELSTEAQRRQGAETLSRLGLVRSVAVVRGTDSHRVRSNPTGERGDGPGSRVTDLALPEHTFVGLTQALAGAVGQFDPHPVERSAIDAFREGRDPSVVAVWRAQDRLAVTRAVAAAASEGFGTILVGVRRGGRGGRGVVIATDPPELRELERWIWSDVTPTPAVDVYEHVVSGRTCFEVRVVGDRNPFTYCVGGEPLVRSAGRVRRASITTPDHAELLGALRAAVSTDLLNRAADERPGALREDEIETLFPWRGYLDEKERTRVLSHLAYRIAKGSDSGILRAWAFLAADEFSSVAQDVVRSIASAFIVYQAKAGLRARLEAVGASRSLRRRVLSAFSGAVEAADPLDLAEESHGSDVLERSCERLAAAVADEDLNSQLRDIAIDEGKRATELIGALVPEEQVKVLIEPVVEELGEDVGRGLAVHLVESAAPVAVVRADQAGGLAGREIALVSSSGDEVLAVGSPIVAIDAPVRDLADVLRKHRDITRFNTSHVLPRDELLDLATSRRDIQMNPDDRVIVFRSAARLGLPAWWAAGDADLAALADGVVHLIDATSAGGELALLLGYLALLPGDHRDVVTRAAGRTRAVAVHDLRQVFRLDWSRRIRRRTSPATPLADVSSDAVTYGGRQVEVGGVPIAEALRDDALDVERIDRYAAEACARHLRNVSSPVLFDVFLRGVREGWQTGAALRRCDEATYLPDRIREFI